MSAKRGKKPAAEPAAADTLNEAIYDVGIIAEILKRLATADISSGEAISGPCVDWLAIRLDAANDRAQEAARLLKR